MLLRNMSSLTLPVVTLAVTGHTTANLDVDVDPSTCTGPLRPSDLPEPTIFQSFSQNQTVTLPNGASHRVLLGTVHEPSGGLHSILPAQFAVVPQAVDRSSIDSVLDMARSYHDWDDDPDTVDGMTSHELFLHTPDLYADTSTTKYRDVHPEFVPARKQLRAKLNGILQPYLDHVITPLVRRQFPEACHDNNTNDDNDEDDDEGHSRNCTPCYSLLRHYTHGRRQSHATHYDGHAIVTVVVSLSDYNIDYRGGLYVATGVGQREYLPLNKGDAVLHRSNVLHGVHVMDVTTDPVQTERWSWIVWYRDSTQCHDFGYEWFADCAARGDAVCQSLHSTKVGSRPGISEHEAAREVLEWNLRAADAGSGFSAVKIARAYLGQLPSMLSYNVTLAERYFRVAMEAYNPEGHYGMAQLLLMQVGEEYHRPMEEEEEGRGGRRRWKLTAWKDERVADAIRYLELASMQRHAFAMFNLGHCSYLWLLPHQ
eukprot:CCRYP_021200-RB/>CCRYP_021200-RB protein AED:0.00 eAED:0.00 QI:91/-1/1/1/-1/1/1/771/482